MYKIAILGCENSHANIFLDYIIKDKKYPDVEVLGVYSHEAEAAQKLSDEYGVYAAKSYDEFVGKADGIIVTARHGDRHYMYAKPYIESGIPMFIDKPVTVTEEDATNLKNDLIQNGVRVCGGSVCKFPELVHELKKAVEEKTYGEVYGGYLRFPVSLVNEHGNFFFYAQHLVEVMCEVFGYYPVSVSAFQNGNVVTGIVRYDNYDVNVVFVDGNYEYHVGIDCEKGIKLSNFELDGCFEQEFESFYKLLKGDKQTETYEDFIAPVFIMNALDRSLKSGKEEKVIRQ